MMERYICIHGHFYQPPRENPWLEAIETQDSAHPYHDWNERIAAECYATNATSRILDGQDRIVRIVNNYSKISFNFGPTLLAWMEKKAPEVYNAILEADTESQKLFSGHGSALAQAYNHMILPLANSRDKQTQTLWGIRDFEHRFGRKPEGMWLPETAVDLETLDIMAEEGIAFTILAPHQAIGVRPIGNGEWLDVSDGKIDTTMPYQLLLPSGRSIVLFFYHGPISRAVAFEKLLDSGESFAKRLLGGFSERETRAQLVHIATDGESYGHHHRFGDMALAYALNHIQSNNIAQLTNYGEYLERHPPTHEVEILENTSWSCAHGVERWRSPCGCHTGKHPAWNQAWRAPLREALDWLRDALIPGYEKSAAEFLKNPWAARDHYIGVISDRALKNVRKFLDKHAARKLNKSEKIAVFKLLEMQRCAMLMYTSCGWFFDELSGIESIQVLQYAGRALHLAQGIFGDALEPNFLSLLARAKSNLPELEDGRRVYEKSVRPAMADLRKVGAYYAVCSLFNDYDERSDLYSYRVELKDRQVAEAGKARLEVGRARFSSKITHESAVLSFGVLHLGDHNMNCGVKAYRGKRAYQSMARDLSEAFERADFPETVRRLDRHFGSETYTLKSLFRNEENKILERLLESTLENAEAVYRQLYNEHAPLMRFLKDSGVSPPRAFYVAAEFALNAGLRQAFEGEELDLKLIISLLEEARSEGVTLDAETLEYAFRKNLERTAGRFLEKPTEISQLQRLDIALNLSRSLPFQVNVWKVQNICYELLQKTYPLMLKKAEQSNKPERAWVDRFRALAEKLSVRVD